ncbi:MAG: hypothetical protein NVS3B16_24490 [Vulcanimicrobiaceae bacterium]
MIKVVPRASLAFVTAIGLTAPVWAADAIPSVGITAPVPGAAPITTADIPVTVAAKNFTIECKHVGQNPKGDRGHYHVMIDGASMAQMTNLYCSNAFSVSGAGLKPGEHTLAVVLATDDHAALGKPALVKFEYRPAKPQPLPQAITATKPVVTIVSPQNGAVVGRKVDLKVAVSGFDLSCDLEGKPNVAGYGHLHVFVSQGAAGMTMPHDKAGSHDDMQKGDMKSDKSAGGMMGMESMAMPGMVGMPCTKTVPVDLSAWKSGKTKLLVMLANNDHMPTAGAMPTAVDVVVK